MAKSITKAVKVHTPNRPNFIRVGSEYVSIAEFSDEDLRRIGKAWTQLLVHDANKKRALQAQQAEKATK